jgi:subtilase family serine protease
MSKSCTLAVVLLFLFFSTNSASASYHFSNFKGKPPIHIYKGASSKPNGGFTPAQIKSFYGLPATGGHGTIVIIGAYDDATLEKDLNTFSTQFALPACTTVNGCFTKHAMTAGIKANTGWAGETSLDVEWAHAIAPSAKILIVEATTPSGANLLKAIDYADTVSDASAISMSWGGGEFPEELTLDSHFKNVAGAPYFASSGDNGAGASWPASSPFVIGVGGTTITLKTDKTFSKETAWTGSGGGVSAYEKQPAFQSGYSIPKANGMRAIPDVSYDADPASGFPIVRNGKWYEVGGTSAGAPQWAGIAALSPVGSGINIANLYADKGGSNAQYFRDITTGSNGDCGYFCTARKHYDYITGLGSPLGDKF